MALHHTSATVGDFCHFGCREMRAPEPHTVGGCVILCDEDHAGPGRLLLAFDPELDRNAAVEELLRR